jgi:ketosteroid isomerase-like protein
MRVLLTIAILLALILSAIWSAAAQPSAIAIHADANPVAEAEIKALELKLAELIVHADWDEYAKHLGPDYIYIRETGLPENKDQALATLADMKRRIIFMEMDPADFVIRIYGDTAVSSARFAITVRDNGQVRVHPARLTHVFVRRDGQWYLLAGQYTPIGKLTVR